MAKLGAEMTKKGIDFGARDMHTNSAARVRVWVKHGQQAHNGNSVNIIHLACFTMHHTSSKGCTRENELE